MASTPFGGLAGAEGEPHMLASTNLAVRFLLELGAAAARSGTGDPTPATQP